MSTEFQTACEHLVSAAINGVYQGMIVAALVALCLRFLARTNAATRHAVWLITLLLLGVLIPTHHWLDQPTLRQATPLGAGFSTTPVPPLAAANPPSAMLFDLGLDHPPTGVNKDFAGASPAGTADHAGEPEIQPDLGNPSPSRDTAVTAGPSTAPMPISTDFIYRLNRRLPWLVEPLLHPVSWNITSVLKTPFLASLAVLAVWLVVAPFRMMLLGWRLHQLRMLARGSRRANTELEALLERLRGQLGIRRRIGLRISHCQRSPVLLGFFNPVILLPAEQAARNDVVEAEQILRHELAHVRRYDDWVNLFQHVIHATLFFHPAVWWISRRLSIEREIACDDHVLQQGVQPRTYALTLANVASRIQSPSPTLAPGVSTNNSQLQQRISMILNTRRNTSPGLVKTRLVSVLSAAAVVAVLALYAGPRLVLAQNATPPPAASAPGVSGAIIASSDDRVVVGGAPSVTPQLVSSENNISSTPAPSVEPGPKFKPEPPDQNDVEPPEPTVPDAPSLPDGEVAPLEAPRPVVARIVKVGSNPRSPRSPDAASESSSVEERLDRLEKMVQSLMARQSPKHARSEIYLKDGAEQDARLNLNDMSDLKGFSERQQARAEEMAKRAEEQGRRAEERAKRATIEFENLARLDQEKRAQGVARGASRQELQALRKARESLGQELERLDRQIQSLEKETKRIDEDRQRRGDAREDGRDESDGPPVPKTAK